MIQQPELGRKIADYRKAKGLTQEDLVEKCNLSVRTLQRIEAGEVKPRTSTVKLIFEALELNYDNSFDPYSVDNQGLFSKRLEQFYISFLDLFNLKTNTMKKVSILSIMLSGIVFGLFTFVLEGKAQDKNHKTNTISENVTLNNQPDSVMMEDDFSCIDCFYDDDELIGYGVKFKKNGVYANVHLIKLNTSTGKFNAGFAKGVFLTNKVEVYAEKKWIDKKMFIFEAKDELEMLEDKYVLKGEAKLMSTKNEIIEAAEIIIHLE
jgi:transcriptional regulator with XRE-family HTH domain